MALSRRLKPWLMRKRGSDSCEDLDRDVAQLLTKQRLPAKSIGAEKGAKCVGKKANANRAIILAKQEGLLKL